MKGRDRMTPVNQETLQALTSGIQAEVASYVFYREALKKQQVTQIRTILEELALEEKRHFHVLERQYDSLVRSEKWISTADLMKQEGLPEVPEEMSRTHTALMGEVAQAASLREILAIALRLEEQARDIYARALTFVQSEEGRKVFERLVSFEEGHVRKVKGMMEKYL
ncbi:MAG TPA: ferritin family protein [candidate division Zixibacteria bacterium]|nr:ferritin family protein [candidate division Zixibacteria bacterium]MDD4917439.1 ferritin family protein [candidate division Zixibacteria bacterium]MDM7972997.1 ferritin family protein [candidate division Zixibacteria bacterium]HOD67283.1 ferritin family protein [candidate division Zixibacteria bacterium]HOZ06860.1 ferritin family protein [candidate division Zixibacteria bacterium]